MLEKMKLKVAAALIAVSFIIMAILTPMVVAHPHHKDKHNRILFMAKGDDLDLSGATNLIIGSIKLGGSSALGTARVVFHQKFYDDSGEKYAMIGMLKDGLLVQTDYYFFCPVFMRWFINVWVVLGEGTFRTTDTDCDDLTYRNWFQITMPNTRGKFVSTPMLMFLSPTAEYCLEDPGSYPPGEHPEVYTLEEGGWVLAAVLCGIIVETPMGELVELPIGPVSYFTRYIEM